MTLVVAVEVDRGGLYRLPPALLDRLEIEAALLREAQRSWLATAPSVTVGSSVQNRVEDAASYLGGLYQQGASLAGADQIQGVKPRKGLRPLTVLTFPQQVLLEALVESIRRRLPPSEKLDWDEFQRAPLADDSANYIVHADVAAFFHYVDHALLEGEIVAQTGEAMIAQGISMFLDGVMGRRFGLPQLYPASDTLSEAVIDLVERRLLRAGLKAWRYRDDFRIAAPTYLAAREAIETLDAEARAVGLTLNEEKTFVHVRGKYVDWVEGPEARHLLDEGN